MHLIDFLELRPVPAAGISFGLTRRCPLHCEHCATSSTMQSEEGDADIFRRFVGTFQPDDHPQIASFSGGEAFLRPELLRELAESARSVGTWSLALSGMYWARAPRIPPAIKRAIDALDHFSASVDVYHEKEVPRADVFRALGTLLADGKDVSIHLVGLDADDPYLIDAVADIRRTFHDRVPVLVNDVSSFGRAEDWMPRDLQIRPYRVDPDPCALAAWPVVSYDGTVVACGNEDVVSGGYVPAHLRLGHAAVDSWSTIRDRTVGSGVLRSIRTYGPRYSADRAGAEGVRCTGQCDTCMNLEHDPELLLQIDRRMAQPSSRVVEQQVRDMQVEAGPETFTRIYGLGRYAELVSLGRVVTDVLAPATEPDRPTGRLDAAAIDELRLEPGASALLFLTDRCPVGCAHCSVDSRRDSPTITDRDAFARIVDGLCADPRIGVVGISGGEPFVERFGLELATRRLHEAGKRIVAYTSGVWAAADGRIPGWVGEVLRRCETVFLSTDAFHADGVPDARFVSAARAIGEAGAWIVVQVVDDGSGPARAAALLREAFGGDFTDHADLVPTAPLTAGRGQQVFLRPKPKPAASFGPCSRLASPMVRYDGTATACCNERVIMGHGPDRFRRSTDGPGGVVEAFDGFHADPLFGAIASVGPGALTLLPRFADLADERFDTICDLCWKLAERSGAEPVNDPVLAAAANLGVEPVTAVTSRPTDADAAMVAASPTGSGASDRLRAKLSLAMGALAASADRVWSSPHVRDLYPVYLATMHGVTRSAAPLLAAASDRARSLALADPVAAGLYEYFARHAVEETGHERWILEDLEAVGADPESPLITMPSAVVAELVGAQYYWLRHHHPACLLGHMAVIEGNPPPVGFAARMQAVTGFPAEAFRTIARHERLDVAHSRELWDLIDGLPLTKEHEAMLGVSAFHTVKAAAALLDQIAAAAPQPSEA